MLIDEYDAVITSAMFNVNVNSLQYISGLVIDILNQLIEGNPYVEKAVIMGISYIVWLGLSGLNNVGLNI